MTEGAVYKDQAGRFFEHVLDDAAAGGVVVAKLRIYCRHPAPDAHARRECGEGVAAAEDGHLEGVRAHGAVGGRLRVKAVAEHEAAQLGAAHDGGEVVLVMRAVGAATSVEAPDLVLFALHLVLAARLELVRGVVQPPAAGREDLVLEAAAPAKGSGLCAHAHARARACARVSVRLRSAYASYKNCAEVRATELASRSWYFSGWS